MNVTQRTVHVTKENVSTLKGRTFAIAQGLDMLVPTVKRRSTSATRMKICVRTTQRVMTQKVHISVTVVLAMKENIASPLIVPMASVSMEENV